MPLTGGGFNTCQVIGNLSRDVTPPVSEPMSCQRVIHAAMHTLSDVGMVCTVTDAPSKVARVVTNSAPISGLL